jgi:hypothetical protein
MHARHGCTRACARSCKEGVRAQTHANVQAHARSRLASMRADSNACTRTREHARSHTKASTCQFSYAARMCADARPCWCEHRRVHVYRTGVGVRKLTWARHVTPAGGAYECACRHTQTRTHTCVQVLTLAHASKHTSTYARTRAHVRAHVQPAFVHTHAHRHARAQKPIRAQTRTRGHVDK